MSAIYIVGISGPDRDAILPRKEAFLTLVAAKEFVAAQYGGMTVTPAPGETASHATAWCGDLVTDDDLRVWIYKLRFGAR